MTILNAAAIYKSRNWIGILEMIINIDSVESTKVEIG